MWPCGTLGLAHLIHIWRAKWSQGQTKWQNGENVKNVRLNNYWKKLVNPAFSLPIIIPDSCVHFCPSSPSPSSLCTYPMLSPPLSVLFSSPWLGLLGHGSSSLTHCVCALFTLDALEWPKLAEECACQLDLWAHQAEFGHASYDWQAHFIRLTPGWLCGLSVKHAHTRTHIHTYRQRDRETGREWET